MMEKSSELKKYAKKRLKGKWNTGALFFLVYFLLIVVLNILLNSLSLNETVTSLISAIFKLLISFGLTDSLFKLFNGEDAKIAYLVSSSFTNIKKVFSIYFHMLLKLICPFAIFMISTFLQLFIIFRLYTLASNSMLRSSSSPKALFPLLVIAYVIFMLSMIWLITKSYYYKLAISIAVANPEISGKEAIIKSEKLMEGKRWKFFYMELTFFGWAILSFCSFGIGFLWLFPYIYFAQFAFYKNALGENLDTDLDTNVNVGTDTSAT